MKHIAKRRPQAKLFTALTTLWLASPAIADPLSCATATEYKTKTTPRYTAEWCANQAGLMDGPFRMTTSANGVRSEKIFLNGKEQGTARAYDRDGTLISETQYENGKVISEKIGREWFNKQANAQLSESTQGAHVEILDDHTLSFTYTPSVLRSSLIVFEGDAFRSTWRTKMLPFVCDILTKSDDVPGYRFEQAQTRIFDSSGATLVEDVIRKNDCQAATFSHK